MGVIVMDAEYDALEVLLVSAGYAVDKFYLFSPSKYYLIASKGGFNALCIYWGVNDEMVPAYSIGILPKDSTVPYRYIKVRGTDDLLLRLGEEELVVNGRECSSCYYANASFRYCGLGLIWIPVCRGYIESAKGDISWRSGWKDVQKEEVSNVRHSVKG